MIATREMSCRGDSREAIMGRFRAYMLKFMLPIIAAIRRCSRKPRCFSATKRRLATAMGAMMLV